MKTLITKRHWQLRNIVNIVGGNLQFVENDADTLGAALNAVEGNLQIVENDAVSLIVFGNTVAGEIELDD